MNKLFQLIACLTFFFLASASLAKEWRGIVPLQSTRTDAQRILGKPLHENFGGPDVYDSDEGRVKIKYVTERCKQGWNVPPNTILSITVRLKNPMPASELKVDLGKLPHVTDESNTTYYSDDSEGIIYIVRNGILRSIMYGPTGKDMYLRCKKESEG